MCYITFVQARVTVLLAVSLVSVNQQYKLNKIISLNRNQHKKGYVWIY